MLRTSSPSLSHMKRNWPGSTSLRAKRRWLSFCQLTLHGDSLRHGLAYQGRRLSPCKVSWQNESHLRFALKDVLPGQLRFMCESEGLEVRSIRRLRIGALSLARLPLGEWRYLGLHERF